MLKATNSVRHLSNLEEAVERMSKDICIYGASNPCILKIIGAINREKEEWKIIGFIDDTPEKQGKEFYGHAILGGKDILESLAAEKDIAYFNNVFGSMQGRRKVAQILEAHRCRLVSLITPGTDLAFVRVGLDVAIEANVAVDADVVIGDHSCLKRSSSVGHETVLGKFVFIGPGATVCGRAKIHDGVFIGAGSCILPGLEIGRDSIIGAGAVVTKNIPPGVLMVGNPAKITPRA